MRTQLLNWLMLAFGLVLYPGCCWALESDEELILNCYYKAGLAAQFKYLDGMLSNRAPEYQLFDRLGHAVDLTTEHERFSLLLDQATRVRLDTEKVSAKPVSKGYVFNVKQVLYLEGFDRTKGLLSTNVIVTFCSDYWIKRSGHWKIARCVVAMQYQGIGDPLPKEYARPQGKLPDTRLFKATPSK